MDFSSLSQSLQESLGTTLPNVLLGIGILLIGWIVARVIRTVVRRGLGALSVDQKMQKVTGSSMPVEKSAAAAAFYVVMALVLLAFFNAIELELVSTTLQQLVDQVFAYAPKVIAAGVLLLVAWLVAVVVRSVVTQALGATGLDAKLARESDTAPVSKSLGTAGYWLVLLLFLPGVLGALEMQGLLAPVQGMVDQILGMLPRILAAAAIGLVGWFLARIAREVVRNLLAAAGADRLGERVGMKQTKLSTLLGNVLFALILLPTVVAALNALAIEAISAPATQMLTTVVDAIPAVFAAVVILAVAWFVAVLVSNVVSGILAAVGVDAIPAKIGLGRLFSGENTLSGFCGKLIVFFTMLFAATEAAERLGFTQVSTFVATMTAFAGQVLLGVAIIGVGLWLSNLARTALAGSTSPRAAAIVRFAILGIVFAMGLRAMGLADEIVNLAFGLTLGSIAVAAALAFGLGGREAAGKQLERWFEGGSGNAKKGPVKSGQPSPIE